MTTFLSNMFYHNKQVSLSYQQETNYILHYLYFIALYLKSTGHRIYRYV